jgi:predicted esterase
MKKVSSIIVVVLLTAFVFIEGQERAGEKFSSYEEMRAYIGKLYQQKEYAEAARILEGALTQFPEHLQANAFNLALMYIQLEEHEKALKALEYGLDHGIWFGKYALDTEIWAPLKDMESFKAFKQKNEAKRQEAQRSIQPKLEVLVPEGFDKSNAYPLFIALHGGGENIDVFKPQWTSDLLKNGFIVAYPQSSQIVSMTGYSWTEDIEMTKKEIRKAYEKVLQDFPVDPSRVIVGGFSSGGVASLEVVLDNTIPAIGFVVLCPAKPDDFSAEKVSGAKERGIYGTLITTEMDPRLQDQKEMVDVMKAQGLVHEFIVTPNIGHWYPENLSEMIDTAITHIFRGHPIRNHPIMNNSVPGYLIP